MQVLRCARGRRDSRGAAAVEFALIAPVLLMLVFGIISYGYMLSFRQAISQAAADGARAAAVSPVGQAQNLRIADAYQRLNDAMGSYGVTCINGVIMRGATEAGSCLITMDDCPAPDDDDQCVTVAISYSYSENSLLPTPGMGLVLPETLAYTAVAEVS